MTIGDGLAIIGVGATASAFAWAVAWCSVRSAAIRDEAMRRLGEPKWTTTRRAK